MNNRRDPVTNPELDPPTDTPTAAPTAWDRVKLARETERPTTQDYLADLFADFVEYHGDRLFGDDRALIGGVASFQGRSVMVLGHQGGANTRENIARNFGMPRPEGYRKAQPCDSPRGAACQS